MSIWGGLGIGTAAVAEPEGVVSGSRIADVADARSGPAREFSAAELIGLVEAGCDWIWETDSELRFSWLSENYEEITGISPREVLGRFRFDFLKQVSKGSVSAAAHVADLEARRPFRNFVYELKGARADCRWISITGYPRFNADGTFDGYRGVARNVTSVAASVEDLERAQSALAEERDRLLTDTLAGESHAERLTAALNAMKDAFCFYDSDDRLVLYNQPFLDLYRGLADAIRPGVSYERLLDIGIERHLWNLEGADPAVWRMQVLARRAEKQWQSTIRATDGRWIVHREMRSDDGSVIGISSDVTDLKERQSEAALASEAARLVVSDLERTLDSLGMGVVLLDSSLRAQVINKAFYDIWKVTPADVSVGSHFRALMDINRHNGIYDVPDDQWEPYVASRLAEIAAGDIAPRQFVRRDGCTMIYSVTALTGGKRLVCYYDITDMKTREAELAVAKDKSANLLADLRLMVDSMSIGMLVLDRGLRAEVINRAFHEIWDIAPGKVSEGSTLREIMEASRDIDVHGMDDADWETHIVRREAELGSGVAGSKEVLLANGRTVICTTVPLSGGKTLASYIDVTELKRREEALRASMNEVELLRHTLDELPVATSIKAQDLRIEYVNKAWSSVTGIRKDEAVGHTDIELFNLSEADGYTRCDRDVLTTGTNLEVEEPVIHHDGTERQLMTRKSRLVAADGSVHLIGSSTDITDVKEREKALRDSMNQVDLLRRTLDELPVMAFIKGEDLRIEYVNKAWTTLTGLSREECVGRTDSEIFNLSEAGNFNRDDIEVLQAGKEIETEEPLTHRDGTARHMITRKSRLVAADGAAHLVGSATDITELKDREKQLKESLRENEIFRSMIDNVPVAIYAKRPDLRLFYVNKGWSHLTGFSAEQALGRTDAEIFGPDGESFMDGDRAVLETMSTQERAETVTGADGTPKHQIARKSVMEATDGSIYLIGSTTDITELKQRERELEEAQRKAVLADRAKSEFLANMSHEIRTPMNGVLGMAELLAKSELNAKQKMFTDIIVKSGNALLTIINDILDFSKIDAGQLVLDVAPFNLAEAIEDVATLVSTRAKEKDLEMIVRVAPNCQQMFKGDVGRFRQIITNLLGNAVKFTDKGHVLVEVTGERQGNATKLKISVADTGIGIPADKLKLVFDKFSQVDSSSTRRHEGTGLGLAITSRLVELMGGEIGVGSVEGQGSTFWFTITLENAGARADLKPPPLDVTGARILVVDDNAVNRAILSEQMQSWSFDSCAAESGAEGIRVLEAAAAYGVPVDCVVLDYQMPAMTGADAVRVIRSRPAIADTPVVMLTSVDQTLSNASYRELGIEAHLIKPARSSALLDALVTTIQKHRSAAGTALPHIARNAAPVINNPVESIAPVGPAPATKVPAELNSAQSDDHRIDILVAEDNEVNQLVFTQILAETSYTFQIAANGRLAVQAFVDMNPRMILMDVSMPEMNGMEATAAIRTAEGGASRVPIVGVTAHALKGDRERCLEAGMDDYLPKPISPKALLEKVEKWVGDVGAMQRSVG